MAVNALLYTWTERGSLVADTPAMVTDTATRACKWLLENSLSGKYKPYNAFFSGSIKTEEVSDYKTNTIVLRILLLVKMLNHCVIQ